jgi:hypothetical protein
MKQAFLESEHVIGEQQEPDELIKLIRKLRWIGLQSEAKELQSALEGFPLPYRGSVVAGPHSTD